MLGNKRRLKSRQVTYIRISLSQSEFNAEAAKWAAEHSKDRGRRRERKRSAVENPATSEGNQTQGPELLERRSSGVPEHVVLLIQIRIRFIISDLKASRKNNLSRIILGPPNVVLGGSLRDLWTESHGNRCSHQTLMILTYRLKVTE
ncbi:hypothetical protein CRENBAI_019973 [Crenichthys baileyi]|uniref:Uncharacterized protein n=1 Tax=Crenichthys baileyi TaxID=28760 RepID=A0AAV9SNX4_9TELE